MHCFDSNFILRKFESPEHILDEFFDVRYKAYERRKDMMVKEAKVEAIRARNKSRFITEVISGEIVILNKSRSLSRAELSTMLVAKGYDTEEKIMSIATGTHSIATNVDYGYLLDMPIYSLTMEQIEELEKTSQNHAAKLDKIVNTSVEDLWVADLDAFANQVESMWPECQKQRSD
jgi:DNA topoisomerase-2